MIKGKTLFPLRVVFCLFVFRVIYCGKWALKPEFFHLI